MPLLQEVMTFELILNKYPPISS